MQVEPSDGLVKIGYTGRRVRERMAEGQTFVPQELTVLAESFGTRADENRLHRLFREFHVRGEWYRMAPPVQDLVDFLRFDGGDLQLWLEGVNPVSGH